MNRKPESHQQHEAQEERAVVEGDVTGNLQELINAMPEGWSRAQVDGHSWGVTRTTRADGKVITFNGAVLRPCEIPAETVWRFLRAAADQAYPPPAAGTSSAPDSNR